MSQWSSLLSDDNDTAANFEDVVNFICLQAGFHTVSLC